MSFHNQLAALCLEKGRSVSVAESCTSGLISSRITLVSGASAYFQGGVIAYQNTIKAKLLGVDKDLLDERKEVGAQVAVQMAQGVKERFNADYSIATTGFAGPLGGTIDNPIGTVFISVCGIVSIDVKRFIFEGDRESIVSQASEKSLEMLCDAIKKDK